MPGEANRIWVYHIMRMRLSGVVKLPKTVFSNTEQDAEPKLDSKQNLLLSGGPILSLNIAIVLLFDLSSEFFWRKKSPLYERRHCNQRGELLKRVTLRRKF